MLGGQQWRAGVEAQPSIAVWLTGDTIVNKVPWTFAMMTWWHQVFKWLDLPHRASVGPNVDVVLQHFQSHNSAVNWREWRWTHVTAWTGRSFSRTTSIRPSLALWRFALLCWIYLHLLLFLRVLYVLIQSAVDCSVEWEIVIMPIKSLMATGGHLLGALKCLAESSPNL